MSDPLDAATAGTPEGGATQQADGEGASQPQGQVDTTSATTTEPDVTFELKLPGGVELDQASADEFKAIVGDKALTASERAQKIVDLAVKRETARVEAHKARVAEWAESVRNDKELGGDKLDQTLAVARKAVDLGPPELKTFLEASGLGNHPAVVKWAYTIGKALSDDRFVAGRPAANAAGDRASRMYPTTATSQA